jgi:hypothetical protein
MVTASSRLAQSMKAAAPVELPHDQDPHPTPIAQAVMMRAEPPPESTPVEIDQRIDRLLAENLALMSERKKLRERIEYLESLRKDETRIAR